MSAPSIYHAKLSVVRVVSKQVRLAPRLSLKISHEAIPTQWHQQPQCAPCWPSPTSKPWRCRLSRPQSRPQKDARRVATASRPPSKGRPWQRQKGRALFGPGSPPRSLQQQCVQSLSRQTHACLKGGDAIALSATCRSTRSTRRPRLPPSRASWPNCRARATSSTSRGSRT